MLDKLKLIYKLSPILLLAITGFSIYFGYNCWQDEITANNRANELSSQLEQAQQQQIKTNEIIAQNEQTKIALENKSIQQQEQINELLKNNQCANELVPSAYAGRLYNRADQIRQSANTSQFIK